MSPRDGHGITSDHVRRQGVHPSALFMQVTFDRLAQVFEQGSKHLERATDHVRTLQRDSAKNTCEPKQGGSIAKQGNRAGRDLGRIICRTSCAPAGAVGVRLPGLLPIYSRWFHLGLCQNQGRLQDGEKRNLRTQEGGVIPKERNSASHAFPPFPTRCTFPTSAIDCSVPSRGGARHLVGPMQFEGFSRPQSE